MIVNQDRHPNFREKDGKLYLVRCFACGDNERGRENYAMAVASGQCAFCGWIEEKPKEPNMTIEEIVNDLEGLKDFVNETGKGRIVNLQIAVRGLREPMPAVEFQPSKDDNWDKLTNPAPIEPKKIVNKKGRKK